MNLKIVREYSSSLNVLYIEDDQETRINIINILKKYFKSVNSASDGVNGLKQYKSFHTKNNQYYDIVITDINMPKLNGLNMAGKILKIKEDQKIIILSMHNSVEYLSQAINMGISYFLTKPLEINLLESAILKISQNIFDKKTVEQYSSDIENLNTQLQEKELELHQIIKKLEAKNLELAEPKNIKIIDEVKTIEKISDENIKKEPLEVDNTNDVKIKTDKKLKQGTKNMNVEKFDEFHELAKIYDKLDSNIVSIIMNNAFDDTKELNEALIREVSGDFEKCSNILAPHTFFKKITTNIKKLAQTMKVVPLPNSRETQKDIFTLLESFKSILGRWKDGLEDISNEDIVILEDSIESDIQMIISLWDDKPLEDSEIEFFN